MHISTNDRIALLNSEIDLAYDKIKTLQFDYEKKNLRDEFYSNSIIALIILIIISVFFPYFILITILVFISIILQIRISLKAKKKYKKEKQLYIQKIEGYKVELDKLKNVVDDKLIRNNAIKKDAEKIYDFIALDFETANNYLNSPCSVGIVAVKNEKIVDKYYSLINPNDSFLKANTNIHGIKNEDVQDAPDFTQIHPQIQNFIQSSKYVIAHNAQFDMSVLFYVMEKYNLLIDNFLYIDSINFTRPQSRKSGNSLQAKLDYFGLVNEKAHNALADAEATAKIVIASVNKSRYKNIHTYIKGYSSIRIKEFSELKPSNPIFASGRRFETVKISELEVSHNDAFDENHPFYNKTIVITGNFENYTKRELMQKIIDCGGIIRSGVSGKTEILISGMQNKAIVGSDGLSSKQRKANELIEKGNPIQIITEKELLKII